MQVERETISRQPRGQRRDVPPHDPLPSAFPERILPRGPWRESFGLLRERTRWDCAWARETPRCARLPGEKPSPQTHERRVVSRTHLSNECKGGSDEARCVRGRLLLPGLRAGLPGYGTKKVRERLWETSTCCPHWYSPAGTRWTTRAAGSRRLPPGAAVQTEEIWVLTTAIPPLRVPT